MDARATRCRKPSEGQGDEAQPKGDERGTDAMPVLAAVFFNQKTPRSLFQAAGAWGEGCGRGMERARRDQRVL